LPGWWEFLSRPGSLYPDPRRLAFTQSQQGTTNTNNQRITEGSQMGENNDLTRGEAEIQKPVAILPGSVEVFDTNRAIQRHRRERPGCRLH
jgi:hypothetical protein